MIELRYVVDTKKVNGNVTNIVRNIFICNEPVNWFVKAHGYYTKQEKKLAKQLHKANMRRHTEK